MSYVPKRFIGEPITAHFDEPPLLEKKPGCPQAFTWQEQHYRISALLNEWHDYRRKGRSARNMQPQHAAVAQGRGSWGVGRDYYRVQAENGQIFEIYYDRAPKGVDERKGAWFLHRELVPETEAPEDE
jgi:hypothetical protein